MGAAKIKKGDSVVVRSGTDKGRTGMKAKAGMWDWDDDKIKKEKARIERALQSGFAILRADND